MDSRSSRVAKRSALLSGVALAALVLSACTGGSSPAPADPQDTGVLTAEECQRNRDVGTITYISGYGYGASAGQMDVFIAEELGYFDDLCLDVEINAAGANGQQLVAAGQAQFTALGSASDVMLAAANSANLTAVATYGTTSPFSIFANKEVKDLKDFEGKTLGYFINLTPIAAGMLDAAGVDISKVELVSMTNYDPTVVTRGQVDGIVGYASNQPERLRAMGEEFSEFFPADYGLQGTYNVMEVNTQFLNENREVAADFMRATLKALEHCLEDEADCVKRVSDLAVENNQGEAFPEDQQTRTWAVESEWVRTNAGGAPGMMDRASWEAEAELVLEYGNLTTDLPELDSMADWDLVADLYDGDGKLIWPGDS